MLRIGMQFDTHYGDSGCTDGTTVVMQDEYYVRVYSSASLRLQEFANDCILRGVDVAVFGSDNIDSNSTNDDTVDNTFFTDAQTYLSDEGIKTLALFGNHENDSITISTWDSDFSSTIGTSSLVTNPWPGAWKSGECLAYYYEPDSDFRIVVCWGSADVDWNDNISGSGNYATSQCEWLETYALNTAKKVIVFCHEHLSDGLGAVTISSANRTAAQAKLEAAGNVIAVFQGHRHVGLGANYSKNINNHITTINSIPYYSCWGSVLANETSDVTSNAYYIIDFDTSGVTQIYQSALPTITRKVRPIAPTLLGRTRSRFEF